MHEGCTKDDRTVKGKIFIVVLLLGAAVMAFSDDYVDDVYYWPSDASSQQSEVSYQPSEVSYQQPSVQVTFIEDSITQHSDTVVKAVIRR